MKLEVGMYVRTKDGNIFKIIGGNVDNWEIDIDYSKLEQTEEYWLELYRYNNNYSFFDNKNVLKASHNIIDLIEVEDYVNGYYVSEIWKIGEMTHYVDEKTIQRKEKQITIQAPSYGGIIHLHNEDIKTVVTKEQFESMEYKAESEVK